MTKNFYLEFDLNQNMLRELRFNFCKFFCIDEYKLLKQIHKEKNKITKNNENQRITLKEINKAYSIFNNISIENIFKIRKNQLLENFFIQPIIIFDKIDKKKLILKIPEILSIVDEIGLDYEWYLRLLNFKERLINNNYHNLNSERSSSKEKENKNLINKRFSSSFEQIKFESNLIKTEEQFFEVVYSIRKIGSLSYYIVDLYETIDHNTNINQFGGYTNKNKENLNIKEKFKKNNIKTTVKLNRFLSVFSIRNEGMNDEDDNNPIKRKAKTKIFNPELCLKKNSISIGTLPMYKNLLDSPIKEQNLKRNVSKKIINNNKDKNDNKDNKENEEEIKKKESYDNKSIDTKESNKTEIKEKVFDKNEYIKRMKSKKKEYNEEDENSPLITKDKFNEILKKNNKRNKILIIIIIIIIIISLIINFSKFIISILGFEVSKNILKATTLLEMLKIDIYVQGILSITYCINEEENFIDISNIQSEAKLKMKSAENHIKLLQSQLNILINNKCCSKFFNILKNKIDIYNLNEDWSYSFEKVDLLEEIRSLSFKIYSLSYSNEICNISSTFYNILQYDDKIIIKGYASKVNEIQKIFFIF